MWLSVKSSMNFLLRYTVIYDGNMFALSRPAYILSLIQLVRQFSHSWLMVIWRLSKGSLGLGIGNFAWSLINFGTMRWIRQCLIRCYTVCVHWGGTRSKKLSIKSSYLVEPGTLLIYGKSYGTDFIFPVENFNYQDHSSARCVNTDVNRALRRICPCIAFFCVKVKHCM